MVHKLSRCLELSHDVDALSRSGSFIYFFLHHFIFNSNLSSNLILVLLLLIILWSCIDVLWHLLCPCVSRRARGLDCKIIGSFLLLFNHFYFEL
jgi:hypothetical protein